jgi:hypothetical protein
MPRDRYTHDCDQCVSLGQFQWEGIDDDLYWCQTGGGGKPTLTARHSSQDSDYTSGMVFADQHPSLAVAYVRAIDAGREVTSPAELRAPNIFTAMLAQLEEG